MHGAAARPREALMRSDIRYNNIIAGDEARLAQAAADKAPEQSAG